MNYITWLCMEQICFILVPFQFSLFWWNKVMFEYIMHTLFCHKCVCESVFWLTHTYTASNNYNHNSMLVELVGSVYRIIPDSQDFGSVCSNPNGHRPDWTSSHSDSQLCVYVLMVLFEDQNVPKSVMNLRKPSCIRLMSSFGKWK